jgi:hypothetical protein
VRNAAIDNETLSLAGKHIGGPGIKSIRVVLIRFIRRYGGDSHYIYVLDEAKLNAPQYRMGKEVVAVAGLENAAGGVCEVNNTRTCSSKRLKPQAFMQRAITLLLLTGGIKRWISWKELDEDGWGLTESAYAMYKRMMKDKRLAVEFKNNELPFIVTATNPVAAPRPKGQASGAIEGTPAKPDESVWGARLADTIKLRADEAKRRGENIVIGLETNNWIPELQKKQNLIQASLVNNIVNRLETELAKVGLTNVKIVGGAGEGLAANVERAMKENNVKESNVIVLASKDTIKTSKTFKGWRGKVFMAAIDKRRIAKEATDQLCYIQLCKMLMVSLQVALDDDFKTLRELLMKYPSGGLDAAELEELGRQLEALKKTYPDLGINDAMAKRGVFLFIPRAKRHNAEELRDIYIGQWQAAIAA